MGCGGALSLMRHAASFGPDNDVIHPPPAFVPKIPAATLSLAGSQATPPLHLPCSSCFFFTYPRFAICSGSQARLPQAECRHRWGAPMAGCGAAEVSRSRMDFCCSGEAVPPTQSSSRGHPVGLFSASSHFSRTVALASMAAACTPTTSSACETERRLQH